MLTDGRAPLQAAICMGLAVCGGLTGPAAQGMAAGAPHPAPAPALLLRGACIVDVVAGTLSEPQDMLIREGRVSVIGRDLPAPDGVTEIDCRGKYAVPGLFDCHTHLAHLVAGGEDSLRASLAEFVHRGVLSVRDVGGPIDVLSDLSARVGRGELRGPEIFYGGPMLEGSPLTWERFNQQLPGFTVAIDSAQDVDSLLPELARRGARFVKTFNHIDPRVYRHLVTVAQRCSLKIVHDPGTPLFHWMPMDEALELGVTSIEHAKAPWPVVLTDELRRGNDAAAGPQANPMEQMAVMMKAVELGVEGIATERLHALAERMVSKGAFLCPTLYVFIAMAEGEEESAAGEEGGASKDGASAAGEGDTAARRAMMKKVLAVMETISRHFVREMGARGVRFLVGQDGAKAEGTFREMGLLAECQVTPLEIIRGATLYPAQWLGVDERLGSIAAGKQADLLILAANPLEDVAHLRAVHVVVQRGRVVSS